MQQPSYACTLPCHPYKLAAIIHGAFSKWSKWTKERKGRSLQRARDLAKLPRGIVNYLAELFVSLSSFTCSANLRNDSFHESRFGRSREPLGLCIIHIIVHTRKNRLAERWSNGIPEQPAILPNVSQRRAKADPLERRRK